jgi:hypothetical protein
VLLNIGGVRALITEDKCLLFEPSSPSSRKFLEIVMPKIQAACEWRNVVVVVVERTLLLRAPSASAASTTQLKRQWLAAGPPGMGWAATPAAEVGGQAGLTPPWPAVCRRGQPAACGAAWPAPRRRLRQRRL